MNYSFGCLTMTGRALRCPLPTMDEAPSRIARWRKRSFSTQSEMGQPLHRAHIERRPEYAMVKRVEILGQEIKPQTRRARIAGRARRPPGDGDAGEDRRRAISGGGAVRGASRIWQRRFGDGGQSRLVGIRSLSNQAVLAKHGVLVPSHVSKNLRYRAVELKQVRHVEVDRHELTIPTVVLRRIEDSCHQVMGINFCERHFPKDHSSRAD